MQHNIVPLLNVLDRTQFPAVEPNSLRNINFFERGFDFRAEAVERIELPIDAFIPEILSLVESNQAVIVVAETGAGKSLRVGQGCVRAGYRTSVTQPRRIATRSLAQRSAQEMGTAVGDEVGFATALEHCASPFTKLLYCTDGLALVKHIREDAVAAKSILIIDEVHEFNLNIEVLLAWARMQMKRDPNFKVVVMSATMEKENLSNFFGGAPIVEVPGRQFPITDLPPGASMVDDALEHIKQGHNVLMFVPGRGEIEKTIDELHDRQAQAKIMPLHADLLPEEQQACLEETDERRIIVATNVAQTSVTVPGIDVVLDSGMERRNEIHDGVEGLYLNPISLADRKQRRGRAGRTKPGFYRDYCPLALEKRVAFPTPEIERTHLDQAVLRLAREGIDMERLPFFHQPERPRIKAAKDMLRLLGCMDYHGKVTPLGERVAQLPVSARVGKMLLDAHDRKVSERMLTVAAIIETGGIINRRDHESSADFRQHLESDLLGEVRLFRTGCAIVGRQDIDAATRKQLLESVGIAPRSFFKALDALHHLTDMFKGSIGEPLNDGNQKDLIRSIIAGLADQVYGYDPHGEVYRPMFGRGIGRKLSRNSVFQGSPPPLVVATPFDLETSKGILNLIESVTKVEPRMAREALPHLFRAGPSEVAEELSRSRGRR